MATKMSKVKNHLIKCIKHDFGFYNPEWKWSSLPKEIAENRNLIQDLLDRWQQEGHIELFEKEGVDYIKIISVPEE